MVDKITLQRKNKFAVYFSVHAISFNKEKQSKSVVSFNKTNNQNQTSLH